MKSEVFSISLHSYLEPPLVIVYRTNGHPLGGGLRFYDLTSSRLIRLLRAMVNVSATRECSTWEGAGMSNWTIAGVVQDAYAAQAALAGSS